MVKDLQKQNLDYACTNEQQCLQKCKRKGIWKSPLWFSGWVEGEKDDCPFLISPKKENILKIIFKD